MTRRDDFVGAAIRDGRLMVAFQPIVDLASGRLRAWEALVRLDDPDHEGVDALAIVDSARRLGLLDQLTRDVVRGAMTTMSEARALGAPATVTVNLEAEQLQRWTGLLDDLVGLVHDGAEIVVELSERSVLLGSLATSPVVGRLREAGVRLAIDDFGAGFAALGLLHDAPVELVKIDRSLVVGLSGSRQTVVMQRVVSLLRELDFHVLVEGLEQPEDVDTVVAMGAELGQGLHFGAPVTGEALLRRLEEHGLAGVV